MTDFVHRNSFFLVLEKWRLAGLKLDLNLTPSHKFGVYTVDPSILRKVLSIQTNTMKWITGRYSDCTKELLTATKWMSVFQLAIYHSLLLYWKINFRNKPERMVRRLQISENSFARMLLTERVWSRVTERYYRMVESSCGGISKISIIKRISSEWVKENVPIAEN